MSMCTEIEICAGMTKWHQIQRKSQIYSIIFQYEKFYKVGVIYQEIDAVLYICDALCKPVQNDFFFTKFAKTPQYGYKNVSI